MAIRERKSNHDASQRNWARPGLGALSFEEPEDLTKLKKAMAPVEFKVGVFGTAAGVGVSTVTRNLAAALRNVDREGDGSEAPGKRTIGILGLGGAPDTDNSGNHRARESWVSAPGLDGLKLASLEMPTRGSLTEDWGTLRTSLGRIDWTGVDLLLIEFPPHMEQAGDLSELLPAIDAGLIVSLPSGEEQERIRKIWRFLDSSNIAGIGLISNKERFRRGDRVEALGRMFGIPLRLALPYRSALAGTQTNPDVLAHKDTIMGKDFSDFSEDLLDYLVWLHDEQEQEEDF